MRLLQIHVSGYGTKEVWFLPIYAKSFIAGVAVAKSGSFWAEAASVCVGKASLEETAQNPERERESQAQKCNVCS